MLSESPSRSFEIVRWRAFYVFLATAKTKHCDVNTQFSNTTSLPTISGFTQDEVYCNLLVSPLSQTGKNRWSCSRGNERKRKKKRCDPRCLCSPPPFCLVHRLVHSLVVLSPSSCALLSTIKEPKPTFPHPRRPRKRRKKKKRRLRATTRSKHRPLRCVLCGKPTGRIVPPPLGPSFILAALRACRTSVKLPRPPTSTLEGFLAAPSWSSTTKKCRPPRARANAARRPPLVNARPKSKYTTHRSSTVLP